MHCRTSPCPQPAKVLVVSLLSCIPLFCKFMDCSLPGSSVHGISQAWIQEGVAISFSRSSWPRNGTYVSCIDRHILKHWATREVRKPVPIGNKPNKYVVIQSLSCVWLFATPWTAACQASLSNSRSSLRLMSIESVKPSCHLILCCPLLLLPPIPPSIRVFSNESALCMRWPKYWSFSFSIIPSKEHPGLMSFRMDWLDLLAVQGTLKSLLQHHSSKHQFFGAQLSS